MQRDVEGVQPVDVYHAGFPCQTFSRAGKRAGIFVNDPRGIVVLALAEYIARPTIFILENVSAFVADFPQQFYPLVVPPEALPPGGAPSP